jgi:hypothetical protein
MADATPDGGQVFVAPGAVIPRAGEVPPPPGQRPETRDRRGLLAGPGCWYQPGMPLLVQSFAAEGFVGQRDAAVCRDLAQPPLPLVPRIVGGAGTRQWSRRALETRAERRGNSPT